MDDVALTQQCKSLRHDLAEAMSRFARAELLAARDTDGDVGTDLQTTTEYDRVSLASVVGAAANRVSQSLRVLEEYGKTISTEFAMQIEQIRYQCYTCGSKLEQAARSANEHEDGVSKQPGRGRSAEDRSDLLAKAQLYCLVDATESTETLVAYCRELASAGVDVFQLRDKDADDRTLLERSKALAAMACETGTLMIVNDRVDIAKAANADGVHVGQSELPVQDARAVLGDNFLIGVSTHDVAQVHEAIAGGADYIGCGPVFSGNTKTFDDYPGPEFLLQVHEATAETPRPSFAIGGIGLGNVDQVIATGFHRVAVTGAIRDAVSPAAAARQLKFLLQN